MRKILILGAGRSSFVLIKYLLENAEQNNWFVRVADFSKDLAQKILGSSVNGDAISFDVNNNFLNIVPYYHPSYLLILLY